MEQYQYLSKIYDRLMGDVDYKKWSDFVEFLMKNEKEEIQDILELGCGTGNVSLELAKRKYDLVSMDISTEMLEEARDKYYDLLDEDENVGNIIFLEQDMRTWEFDVYEIDCVLSANDGFNYITNKKELEDIFKEVYKRLRNKGRFIFDVSSEYKLKTILGNNTYGENFEDLTYLWENFYDEEKKILNMDFTYFLKEGELFQKYQENHVQRAYSLDEIMDMLKSAGFEEILTYGDFDREKTDLSKAERIFITAKK